MKPVPPIEALELISFEEAKLIYPQAMAPEQVAFQGMDANTDKFGVDSEGTLWLLICWLPGSSDICGASYWTGTKWKSDTSSQSPVSPLQL